MGPIIFLLVIGLIIFFYFMLIYYQRQSKTCESAPSLDSSPTTDDEMTNKGLTETGKVVFATIKNSQYQPRNIVVELNTTVIWTNEDSDYHSVTSLQGSELRSSLLKFREQYSHTFQTPGSYVYYCTLHPYMMATVKVLDS